MKILITGSAGFIGFHLSKALLDKGCEVVGVDNINDYYDVNLKYSRLNQLGINKKDITNNKIIQSEQHKNYQFIKADITDRKTITELFQKHKFDKVMNLAAQAGVRYSIENPLDYVDSNLLGFANILEGCRHNNIKHLVYASSSSVYGGNTKMPFSTKDAVNHPVSLYAASKKANELMAHTYSHLYKIPTTGLRFFTVYGPWDRPDMALQKFTRAILNNEPIKIFNHGKHQRDFTYIDDIISGVIKVIDKPAQPNPNFNSNQPDPSSGNVPYKIYNIGNNNPVELMTYIKEIEKNLKKEAIKEYLPLQDGDVKATYANITPMQRDFNYQPKTNIKEGIKNFVKWYVKYTQQKT
ncbi:MAG: NAD-dependent epimerase [Gammaproteobacteria bacterium]|nr:MAG: NAD-dependent epimerase [Gammaproteobacteria bacterium]